MSKSKVKVCAILWRDASFIYTKKLADLPMLQLTTGFIIEDNKEFINIAMNVNYNPKVNKFWALDGFIIPKKAVVKSEIIYSLNGIDESN